jgi:hypothetical protein
MIQRGSYIWFSLLMMGLFFAANGCGSSPSHQDHLQEIINDTSLSEEEKLQKLAERIFNLASFSLGSAGPLGHQLTLEIHANDDSVVRKIMEGKDSKALNAALKEFHLKTLQLQLADYLLRAQEMHVQQLSILIKDSKPAETTATPNDVKYQLVLERKQFAEFLSIAKLRPQESIPKAEKLWTVVVDGYR